MGRQPGQIAEMQSKLTKICCSVSWASLPAACFPDIPAGKGQKQTMVSTKVTTDSPRLPLCLSVADVLLVLHSSTPASRWFTGSTPRSDDGAIPRSINSTGPRCRGPGNYRYALQLPIYVGVGKDTLLTVKAKGRKKRVGRKQSWAKCNNAVCSRQLLAREQGKRRTKSIPAAWLYQHPTIAHLTQAPDDPLPSSS